MRASLIILGSVVLVGCVSEVDKCISQELKLREAREAVSFSIWDEAREDQWEDYKKRFCPLAGVLGNDERCEIPPEARVEFDRLYDEKRRLELESNVRKLCMRQLSGH